MPETRRSPFAGSWYPGDAAGLRALVDSQLEQAGSPGADGELRGLVSPHAGLVYSGPVAAHGYALLRGRRELTVLLLGPSHHHAFEGLALWASGGFETPLGRVPVDPELCQALAAMPGVRVWHAPHQDEHCLEMQLPFLQRLVPGVRIVPLLMGRQDRAGVSAAARVLAVACERSPELLLVASSDLSHYHPAARAAELDAQVVDAVARFDPAALMQRLEQNREHACGGGPIVAVLEAARAGGADRARVLCRADSGDAGARDKQRVVGYLSAALLVGAL